jgi:hypothetical protein
MRSFLKKIPGSTVGLLWSNVGSLIGRSSCYLARGEIVNFGGKGGLVCNSLSGRSWVGLVAKPINIFLFMSKKEI